MLNPHLIASTRPVAKKENIIIAENCRITVLTDCLFRIEQSEAGGQFVDLASKAVWFRDHDAVKFTQAREGDILTIKTQKATLIIDLKDIKKSKACADGKKPQALDNDGNLYGTIRTLDVFGKEFFLDKTVTVFDKNHIKLENGVVSKTGVAVYDDSNTLLLNSNGGFSQRDEGYKDLYVFAYGLDYFGAIKGMYSICGAPPILPRWALGNWWSRYYKYTEREYLNLMDNFADEEIPLSVAVLDMDWHYVNVEEEFGYPKEDYKGAWIPGWTGYTWNKKLFPDHKKLLTELKNRDLRISLNLHPADGIRWFEESYESIAKAMGIDPKSKKAVEFNIADADFVNNYFDKVHHPLEDEGVDFWWVDWQQGNTTEMKGLDPLWALNHYHYLDNQNRTQEGLILSRYAGFGSHRYPLGFSGDTLITWDFLKYIPYFTSTASNAGYTWWSHDIGGHHSGEKDDELYLRWIQFGVFNPINRLHCADQSVVQKEPWANGAVKQIANHWLRLRHKLVPYIYTYAYLCNTQSIPLVTPMYYSYPEKQESYECDEQYMFGHELLVAPVVSKSIGEGYAETEVWLPDGNWTDFFSGFVYKGGRKLKMYRDQSVIPVFAKQGAIIPMSADKGNGCPNPKNLEVHIFNGNGSFVMYESEEQLKDSSKKCLKQFTSFNVSDTGESLILDIDFNSEFSQKRNYRIYFRNIIDGTAKILINGKEHEAILKYNNCLQVLMTDISSSGKIHIEIIYKKADELETLKDNLLKIFTTINAQNIPKLDLWNKIKALDSRQKIKSTVQSALELSDISKKRLLEII